MRAPLQRGCSIGAAPTRGRGVWWWVQDPCGRKALPRSSIRLPRPDAIRSAGGGAAGARARSRPQGGPARHVTTHPSR
jgi:hypothetical protein